MKQDTRLPPAFSGGSEEARIRVKVNPRSSKDELVDLGAEAVRAKLTAPPVGGEANRALVQLLARAVKVPKKDVEIVSGGRSRLKTVRIRGIGAVEVVSRLNRVVRS